MPSVRPSVCLSHVSVKRCTRSQVTGCSGGVALCRPVRTVSDVAAALMSVQLTTSPAHPSTNQSFFYRAMLCIRGTSHGPVSVCLSVTSRCSTKTAKRRITQTTPHDSPGTLVFLNQKSPRNSTGVTPYGGTKCRWGGSKLATFDKYLENGKR